MTELLQFPPGFLWGTATSSYQIEGAWDADGKGESIWDRFSHTPGKVKQDETGDTACDHYRRYADDVALMQSLGLKLYRFSISWPRVLPAGRGVVNPAGLDFYSRLVDALLEAGIAPMPTLYHWDLPQALQDEGGWEVRSTAEAFVEYADAVSRHLGDRVTRWCTHNESSVVAWVGNLYGFHAPGKQDLHAAVRVSHHVLLSHGLAVPVLRANSPGSEVGIAVNINHNVAGSPSAMDTEALRRMDGMWTRWFMDPLFGKGYPEDIVADFNAAGGLPDGMGFVADGDLEKISTPLDFLGLNYYNRTMMRVDDPKNDPQTVFQAPKPGPAWTEMDWESYPEGLYQVLHRVHREYTPPKIYITENGASFSTGPDEAGVVRDSQRQYYLQAHFAAAHKAIAEGVPLAGYCVWSFLDNFEWAEGYRQRFGIVWVDFETLERTLKQSAHWYRTVIDRNGLEAP
jgi:beta-glucosidase